MVDGFSLERAIIVTTHTVMLNLPEPLYQRLSRRSKQSQRSLEDELLSLLATKTLTAEVPENIPLAYDEVIEFLGCGATAQEIADFRLSPMAQARGQSLLTKNKEGDLTPAEEAELDLYIELEDFMSLIKIRAIQQLKNHS